MKGILAAVVVAIGLSGCASVVPSASYTTMDKSAQSATTADAALAALKAGNARFVSGNMIKRDLMKQVKATGYGQYPIASIVSCIDSRVGPEIVFDQGIGDVFSARVAGNFVNEDILGSLEFGSKAAGSKLIVVLGHTSCGAIKGACDDVALGNLTGMLAKIKPAVASVSSTGDRSSKNDAFVQMVAEANVKRTVNDIFVRSPVLKAMADKGEIKIVGAMLDVKTGVISWY
ncbi:MAG TPA: carbonic anhydrase family protein [Casimicrobium sp.]|nr:carbonic anhydrase family protein [Casimicrobium sp.]